MANENDNTDPKEQPEKKTWLDEALDHIDSDFPLSGGEQGEDLEFDLGDEEDDGDDDVNTRFPLSGGEKDDQ